MPTKKTYSQAARVQGIVRTLGARRGITIGELAEGFVVTKRTLYRDLKALGEGQTIPFFPKWLRGPPTGN
jgi:predicted DNA-binding transcriptional regulator YafY